MLVINSICRYVPIHLCPNIKWFWKAFFELLHTLTVDGRTDKECIPLFIPSEDGHITTLTVTILWLVRVRSDWCPYLGWHWDPWGGVWWPVEGPAAPAPQWPPAPRAGPASALGYDGDCNGENIGMRCWASGHFYTIYSWYGQGTPWNNESIKYVLLTGADVVDSIWQSKTLCPTAWYIWVRWQNCGCLVTWFCYQLIAKPGNRTATVSWPDPYMKFSLVWEFNKVKYKPSFVKVRSLKTTEVFIYKQWLSQKWTDPGEQTDWQTDGEDKPISAYPWHCRVRSWVDRWV